MTAAEIATVIGIPVSILGVISVAVKSSVAYGKLEQKVDDHINQRGHEDTIEKMAELESRVALTEQATGFVRETIERIEKEVREGMNSLKSEVKETLHLMQEDFKEAIKELKKGSQ